MRTLFLCVIFCLFGAAVAAQGANVAFGAVKADPSLPVEVTADNLNVNQEDGSAEFTGNVFISQGEMRLSAKRVLVIYEQEKSGIQRMEATGDVVLVSGPDAAQAERADYTIETGVIVMTGDVLLTQGQNTVSSNEMVVNLVTGTAQMAGRVKTILKPEGN
ncbi:MAG: lipopolysaccharide transport periplasmic protein LptA [Paracoccaceae bacterium]